MKKSTTRILFTFFFYCLAFAPGTRAEVLYGFRIPSLAYVDNYFLSVTGSPLGGGLKLFLDAELQTWCGQGAALVDRGRPILGVWLSGAPEGGLSFPSSMVLMVPVAKASSFLSGLPESVAGKDLGEVCALSKTKESLEGVEAIYGRIRHQFASERGSIFVKIYVAEVWKRYGPVAALLRGLLALGVSDQPSLQKQFSQFLEFLFWILNSLSEVNLEVILDPGSRNQKISLGCSFFEDSPFINLFPGFPQTGGIQNDSFISLMRVAFDPAKIKRLWLQYINRLERAFLADRAEIDSLRAGVKRIWGNVPDGTLLLFDSVSFLDKTGHVTGTLRMEEVGQRFHLKQVQKLLEGIFL